MKLLILLALVAFAAAEPTRDWTSWSCPLPRIGLTPECPAFSCRRILELNPFAKNGLYWFRLDGTLFQAHCDMINGGFMMVVRFPKCWIPDMRVSSSANEIVTRPNTIWEMLDSIVEFNEGKLETLTENWWLDSIYKNRAWRFWNQLDIKRVRISFWKSNHIVKSLEFDALGADRWSWFDWNRLIRSDFSLFSSWYDIKNRTGDWPVFSWTSWPKTQPHRDWMLVWGNAMTHTCNDKAGWFWGVNNIKKFNTVHKCTYETTNCEGVHFLFSKLNRYARFHVMEEIDIADAVTLSFQ